MDRKSAAVKQVFSKDSHGQFDRILDETLCSWLKRFGCIPYKIPPYHLKSSEETMCKFWKWN